MSQPQKEKSTAGHKVFTVVGIILCVILVPMLIVNVTLIIKGFRDPDHVPKFGGLAPLIVKTGSMSPLFEQDDLIFVKEVEGSEVEVGDVIAFIDPTGNGTSLLTHRVVEKYEEDGVLYFITRGDTNKTNDPAVSEEALVGRYTDFHIGGGGKIVEFMQSPAGLIVCVFLPLVLLIAWDIFRRRRHEKNNRQDTEALLAELEALKAEKAAKAEAPAAEQEDTPSGGSDTVRELLSEAESAGEQEESSPEPQ